MEEGRRAGLISDERYDAKKALFAEIDFEISRVEKTYLSPSEKLNSILLSKGSQPVSGGAKLADLIRRPEMNYKALAEVDTTRPDLSDEVFERAEIEIKYAGYIKRQLAQAEQFKKLESKLLPENIDYHAIEGLRLEARQKLNAIRPENIGRASRISGVSPADITVLLIYLNLNER